MMGPQTNSMNVNIRDKIELKKVYEARNNPVKDEKGDLVTDSSVLRIGRRITCQQLNICRADNVRNAEIQTADPLEPLGFRQYVLRSRKAINHVEMIKFQQNLI
jgi:hypothetical protein